MKGDFAAQPVAFSLAYSDWAELGSQGDEAHGLLLSPYIPGSLFRYCVQGEPRTGSSGSDLRAEIVHQGLHLVSKLLSFVGLGSFLKAAEPFRGGEELCFSEGPSGTCETSFICLCHRLLYEAVVKHPLLGS